MTTKRVALVTGGASYVGRSVCERLAVEGYAIAVLDSADGLARTRRTAAQIVARGGVASALEADVADELQMSAVFDRVGVEFGGLDIVVNAAGIMLLGPIIGFDLADLDLMQRINVRGSYVVSQLAATRVRRGGSIINVSTTVTKLQTANHSAWAASKMAVNAITLILAKELRSRDIAVNAVVPGHAPGNVARVVSLLAGSGSSVTGQILSDSSQSLAEPFDADNIGVLGSSHGLAS